MIVKSPLVWLLIAAAETLHGILRVKYLNPRLGDRRARRLSVLSGTTIIVLIACSTVPWINPTTRGESVIVGMLWTGAMLTFDIAFGRYCLGFSWKRIWSERARRLGAFIGSPAPVYCCWAVGSFRTATSTVSTAERRMR